MKQQIRRHVVTCTVALSLILGGGLHVYAVDKSVDTVYHNGHIYTLTESPEETKQVENAKMVEVVATKDGKILFAGSKAEATAKGFLDAANVNAIVDLKGKTMLPGFVDGHGHFPNQGNLDLHQVNLNSPPLGTMNSIADYIDALKAKAASTPDGDWIEGWGYDDSLVTDMRHPTRYDLDKVSPTHPVVVKHISEHMSVANSKALQLAGITRDTTTVGVVKDADGEPTGLLQEAPAMGLIAVPASTDKTKDLKDIARANQVYAAAGVTTADQGGAIIPMQHPALQNALKQNLVGLRVVVHPFGYMMYGTTDFGFLNRVAFGWQGEMKTGFMGGPSSDSKQVGDDITSMPLITMDGAGKLITIPAPEGLPKDRFMFGAWKFISDGSNQGYTGYFKNPGYYDWGPYTPADNDARFPAGTTGFSGLKGTMGMTTDQFKFYMKLYHQFGQPTEFHTNGSGAAELWVSALEEAVAAAPNVTDMRHTSIHAQMMERQHVERVIGKYDALSATAGMYTDLDGTMKSGVFDDTLDGTIGSGQLGELMKNQNIINSYYVNHTYFWGDRHSSIFMGPGRANNMSPTGWSAAYGNLFSFHNDTTVTPISPLRSIQSGVTRLSFSGNLISGEGQDVNAKVQLLPLKTATEKVDFWNYDQRINVLQALHAVTVVPAFQNRLENRIGSIAEGKFADFTVLDENIFTVAAKDPTRLANLRVATTIVGDKVVHGVLPGADSFAGQFMAGYEQPDNVLLNNLNARLISKDEAEKAYAPLPEGTKRLATFEFTAKVTEGKSGIFMLNFLGNGATVADFQLHKLYAAQTKPYTYGKPTPVELASETPSGKWWVASMANPTVALAPTDKLAMDETYVAFLIIQDNDTQGFDVDATLGSIKDPVSLATTGALPTNGDTQPAASNNDDGGSSSGCTVTNGAPAYDMLLLLLAFVGLAVMRKVRQHKA